MGVLKVLDDRKCLGICSWGGWSCWKCMSIGWFRNGCSLGLMVLRCGGAHHVGVVADYHACYGASWLLFSCGWSSESTGWSPKLGTGCLWRRWRTTWAGEALQAPGSSGSLVLMPSCVDRELKVGNTLNLQISMRLFRPTRTLAAHLAAARMLLTKYLVHDLDLLDLRRLLHFFDLSDQLHLIVQGLSQLRNIMCCLMLLLHLGVQILVLVVYGCLRASVGMQCYELRVCLFVFTIIDSHTIRLLIGSLLLRQNTLLIILLLVLQLNHEI